LTEGKDSSPSARTRTKAVRIRSWRAEDIPKVYACQRAAYVKNGVEGWCSERQLAMQLNAFPEGQLVAVIGDEVVGYATSLIVLIDDEFPWHSYAEVTGNGSFSTHDPSGDTLYGSDIAVHPDHRGRGIAGKLYEGRKRILKRFNLRRMVAGGRIPGYREHAGKMTAEEYVAKVVAGELNDQALNAHLKSGYQVKGVHMGYLHDDQSLDYATLLELENPAHTPKRRYIAGAPMKRPVRKVRVCCAQYEMRPIKSWEDFEHQVEFFVSTAEEYNSHFLLMPELFTAQLFSTMPRTIASLDGMNRLADMAEAYREMFVRMAAKSGLMIVGGTHPVRRDDGKTYNVAHLFTPSGNIYTQDKLHVTPNERLYYGISPGEGVSIFETAFGRIAIVICYDIEFPELSRLLTLAGVEIIFVPFSTDERKAYLRVRYSSQARAVENCIYTALSGNVGNLPQVENFLINYGQALICTPSDIAFPNEAIAATADFNTETVVIADLDLGALEQAREVGSVRPLRDRRTDIYSLEAKTPIQRIFVR
jgi:predicted amidohydrolase/ribosomal protein S18 acetylase RimI-like enzyme